MIKKARSWNNSMAEAHTHMGAALVLVASMFMLALLIPQTTITGMAVGVPDTATAPTQKSAPGPLSVPSPVPMQNLTIADAENAIWEGERTMADLQGKGFNVQFINDTLIEARRVLQKANYTERLKAAQAQNDTESAQLLQESISLMSATYSGSTPQESYAEVLRLVEQVKQRRDPAYLLIDKLAIVKKKLTDYGSQGLPTDRAAEMLRQAEQSFNDERYEEALRYVDETNAELERTRAESPLLRALEESSRGFLEKNWKQLFGMLIVFSVAGWFVWKRMGRYQLKQRITRLSLELQSLAKLMEDAQRDCFERKSISKMTYDLRMDTYRKRRTEILVLLPTLQEEYRMLTGKALDSAMPKADAGGVLKVEVGRRKK